MNLLERYRSLEHPKIIGLMSGTSIDAIDAAFVELQQHENEGRPPELKMLSFSSLPLPEQVRSGLKDIFCGKASVQNVCDMNWLLGELFSEAALKAMREASENGQPVKADLIASHGQTIAHYPAAHDYLGRTVRSTMQIGEGAVIAERTGCLTVCDFRPQDMACGGQGAPLVPFADRLLFHSDKINRVALNIGGMSNITWIPREGKCSACDTGPGNVLCDRLAEIYLGESCDKDGRMAASGEVIEELMERLMAHPFLKLPAPKSTGREEFGAPMADKLAAEARERGWKPGDLMRTAAAFTAASIAVHIKPLLQYGPCSILTGGGGVHNKVIMAELRQRLEPDGAVFEDMESCGVPSQAREAAAFALFGHCTALGRAGNLPEATGAQKNCCLGKIVFP